MNVFTTSQKIVNQDTMLSSVLTAESFFIHRHQTLLNQRQKAIKDRKFLFAEVIQSKMIENQNWFREGHYNVL